MDVPIIGQIKILSWNPLIVWECQECTNKGNQSILTGIGLGPHKCGTCGTVYIVSEIKCETTVGGMQATLNLSRAVVREINH